MPDWLFENIIAGERNCVKRLSGIVEKQQVYYKAPAFDKIIAQKILIYWYDAASLTQNIGYCGAKKLTGKYVIY